MRTVYLNGEYVAEDQAKVSVFDRGFMFADAIYEVTAVLRGKLVDFDLHVQRLRRSLGEMGMALPFTDEQLLGIHRRLIDLNALDEGLVYLQITRGAEDRNFLYPATGVPQTVVLYTQAKVVLDSPLARRGMNIVGLPDLRWGRSDIKTTQLLYACMAKEQARQQGADDAWLIKDGLVTEGTSNNAFIITADGVVVTRGLSSALLPGVTRGALIALLDEHGLRLEERAFSLEEARAASEAFITSSTSFIYPVVRIDGQAIGDGTPGAMTLRLRQLYIEHALAVLN
ncbi:D-amino-acid transaminase [Pseudomonas sp. NPDC089734]|uniref:D-amino-acid transaminase n=1 Tax=Pseudomonas sp. NPDC089734 TaxID=3364469 RepID=UPI00380218E5